MSVRCKALTARRRELGGAKARRAVKGGHRGRRCGWEAWAALGGLGGGATPGRMGRSRGEAGGWGELGGPSGARTAPHAPPGSWHGQGTSAGSECSDEGQGRVCARGDAAPLVDGDARR